MRTNGVKALLGLIADGGSTASIESYHAELLGSLSVVFPCEVANFNEFQLCPPARALDRATVTCSTSPPIEPAGAIAPALLAAFLRNVAQHPLIRLHAGGDRCVHRLSDVTSLRSFRRLALYGEFFRPAAIGHQLTLVLDGPPGPLVGIWLSRSRRDFSEDDLLLAELLCPHLQAAELAARRAVARATLTSREREVLDLVSAGATNAAVAEALVVSPGTVKKHLDNIYGKLDVRSRTAAALRAHR